MEALKAGAACAYVRALAAGARRVLLACLLPHPPPHTRHAGHWDALCSTAQHLRDGLCRLYCLVPYGVLAPPVWDAVLPAWMEAICGDVPEKVAYYCM